MQLALATAVKASVFVMSQNTESKQTLERGQERAQIPQLGDKVYKPSIFL